MTVWLLAGGSAGLERAWYALREDLFQGIADGKTLEPAVEFRLLGLVNPLDELGR